MNPTIQIPLLQQVTYLLQTRRIEAYLVGGAVRDLLLGRTHLVDLDFTVPVDGLNTARYVADQLQADFYPLDPVRGTGRVVSRGDPRYYLDFATFRGSTLYADLKDRDFTINAMAFKLDAPDVLIDPFNGQADLTRQMIRVVTPTSLHNDPLRVLRAVRQASAFGFTIEPHTETCIRQASPALTQVSPERQREELVRLLDTAQPAHALQTAQRLDILPHILPDIQALVGVTQGPPHYLPVFEHTLAALNAWDSGISQAVPESLREPVQAYLSQTLAGDLTREQLVRWALLWHDTGKPHLHRTQGQVLTRTETGGKIQFLGHERISQQRAQAALAHFRFSKQALDFVTTVVGQHMRPLHLAQAGTVTRRAIYRFFQATHGEHAGVAVALHALADHQATYPPGHGEAAGQALAAVVAQLLRAYFEQRDSVVEPPPLLTGHDLMDTLHLKQGKVIGVLLGRLKEAQATGAVTNRAEALAFIQADPDYIATQQR